MIKQFIETKSLIDKTILVFFILFLISLNNSIFVNQIGYFGSLIFFIIKYVKEKKNPFKKSGLEIFFLLFLLTEIVAAIFSENSSEAFRNVFKRAILIPIIYVTASVFQNNNSIKNGTKIYLSAAVITIAAYLIFAYEHFVAQLYQIESKGPSPFQYVMTAGGLISFVAIFLFAFLFTKKISIKNFILLSAFFLLTVAALFASYTRAAWIGAFAGFVVLIIFNKKWWLIILAIIAVTTVIIISPNESKLFIYENDGQTFTEKIQFETEGKINSITMHDGKIYVADNSEAVSVFSPTQKLYVQHFPAIISNFYHWYDDVFVARSVEGRFFLFSENEKGSNTIREFLSPGIPAAFATNDSTLIIADSDSGLSVFDRALNILDTQKQPNIISLFLYDGKLITAIRNYGLKSWQFENSELALCDSIKINMNSCLFIKNDSTLFAATDKGLYQLSVASNKLKINYEQKELTKVVGILKSQNGYHIISNDGSMIEAQPDLTISEKNSLTGLNKPINSLLEFDSLIVTSLVKTNRLLSIFDPNHITNIQRISQWKAAWKAASNKPFTGYGDIDMKEIHARFKPYYEKEVFGHFHNNYFHMFAALGFIGGSIFLIMMFSILFYHFKTYRASCANEPLRIISSAALAVFVGFMVSGLAEFNFGDHEIITVIWFTLGLQFAIRNELTAAKHE